MNLKIFSVLNSVRARQISIRTNVRSYIPGIKPQVMNEQFYMKKDKISQGYTIIYRAPMENYLSMSKNVTTVTAGSATILTAYKIISGEKITTMPDQYIYGDLMLEQADLLIFATGFILITLILRIFISKYPLRIYRNENKYIAVFQGQLPTKDLKVYFNKGEISESKTNQFNPWSQSMYKMENKNVILLTEYFKTPSELTNMLLPPVKKE